MTCIRPSAPAFDLAVGLKLDSVPMTARMSRGSRSLASPISTAQSVIWRASRIETRKVLLMYSATRWRGLPS